MSMIFVVGGDYKKNNVFVEYRDKGIFVTTFLIITKV